MPTDELVNGAPSESLAALRWNDMRASFTMLLERTVVSLRMASSLRAWYFAGKPGTLAPTPKGDSVGSMEEKTARTRCSCC